MMTSSRALALCCSVLWSVATGASRAATPADADLVARGKYLATVGDCMACHTAQSGQPYAGGYKLVSPVGTFVTPNITPDKATGIGNWSDDDFWKAMHDGIGKHGEYLYPAMPFPWYTNVSREDVLAIKAYLFSLPPVHRPNEANELKFPFTVRPALAVWREVFFKPGAWKPDPAQSAEVNRGDYLVNGLAHCGECHNSRLFAGNSAKFQKPLQGGHVGGWYAPNITADVRDGIGSWSEADLVAFFKKGVSPTQGVAAGPMAEAQHSLADLSDADLKAMAAYLKSTPPVDTAKHDTSAPATPQGAQAYLDNCASCHGVDGRGIATLAPALAGNGSVLAKGPDNVLQVVLGGLPARGPYAPMLAIGAGMSDDDVAQVANYVRKAWGNDAPATATAGQVAKLRANIDTPMTAGPLHGCPAVTPAPLAKLVADPKAKLSQQLAQTNGADMPQRIPAIVAAARAAAPGAPQAALVNGLTAAYCPVVRNDAQLDRDQKSLALGHFSELVYTQLTSRGLVAAKR